MNSLTVCFSCDSMRGFTSSLSLNILIFWFCDSMQNFPPRPPPLSTFTVFFCGSMVLYLPHCPTPPPPLNTLCCCYGSMWGFRPPSQVDSLVVCFSSGSVQGFVIWNSQWIHWILGNKIFTIWRTVRQIESNYSKNMKPAKSKTRSISVTKFRLKQI